MNIITVLPHEGVMKRVIRDIRDVYREDLRNKICYITLNKPQTSLIESLIQDKANLNRFFIIDAITKSVVKDPKGPNNCVFVNSPIDFEELFSKVDEILNREEFGAVVFDSVCTLFSYGDQSDVLNFLRMLALRVSIADCEGIFVAIKPNIKPEILEQLNDVADKFVYLDST